ncbi:MAG TPA: PD-(D/E)XK nuclease family protein [Bryobacteraceae bacterium]|nr:PD-(D/E)XK nuclease family protein [Bryobacteraceae bacterium]
MPVAHGPESYSFLDDALEAVRGGAALITANRRLSRTLRERYNAARIAAGERVWEAPQIVPIGPWLSTLWEQRVYRTAGVPLVLTEEQEQSIWEAVVRATPESESVLSVSATATAAASSWGLMHAWRLDRREIQIAASEDTRAFLSWCEAFEARCGAGNWVDSARLSDCLASALRDGELPARILLAGFDEITPQQLVFVDACRNAGTSVAMVEAAQAAPGGARRVACLDRRHEVAVAARWARSLVELGESSIAVVVPDLEARRREVERTFSDILHPAAILPGSKPRRRAFNLSAGRALVEYPLIRAALLALRLQPAANPIGPLGAFLRSAYIRGASSERSLRAALDAALRRLGVAQVSIATVAENARRPGPECPSLRRSLAEWSRVRESVPEYESPGGWARDFSRLLDALGWPGDGPLSSDDFQATGAWSGLLTELARLDALGGELSYSAAVSRLERMASEAMFQPESAPAPIQVLGALEAAGARFDHLWITGMDDESWPAAAHPDPFLPAAVQKAHNIPHSSPQRELEFARRRTAALLAAAPSIIVSHATRDGDRELGPSPLIRDIDAGSLESLSLPSYASLVEVALFAPDLTNFEDQNGPALTENEQLRGGSKLFKLQAECPFRAFAELRLGAAPLETPEDGLGYRERGNLVHAALEHIWRRLGNQAELLAASPAEVTGIIGDGITHAFADLATKRGAPLLPRFAELELRRLESLLREWLEIEKQRPPFEAFEIEFKQEVEINGLIARVRIDRIDRLADGRDVVIDYKTGEAKLASWEGDRPSEPQVPLYAVTHEGTLAAAALASLKTGQLGFRAVSADPPALPGAKPVDMDEQKAGWRAVLDRLAAAFKEGYAPVDPKKPQVCENCPLASLCRIHEARLGTSALSGEVD